MLRYYLSWDFGTLCALVFNHHQLFAGDECLSGANESHKISSIETMIFITINYLLHTLALSWDGTIVLHILFQAKTLQFDAITVSIYFNFQISITTRFNSIIIIATTSPNLLILTSFERCESHLSSNCILFNFAAFEMENYSKMKRTYHIHCVIHICCILVECLYCISMDVVNAELSISNSIKWKKEFVRWLLCCLLLFC